MKNNKKVVNAWCMYDWAVSVYSLVIASSIFPVYYSKSAVNATGGDVIEFLGFPIRNSVLYSYSLSFTFLLMAFMSPILTAMADYSGKKKVFMRFFCILGGLACSGLFFFTGENVHLAIVLFIIAGLGYSGSFVFYNSYLPEIATEDQFDRISSKGFALGYAGSVILLVFCLTMILKPEMFGGISSGLASRLSFLLVGVWWILFAQYTFYHLPKDTDKIGIGGQWLWNGFKELKIVFDQVKGLTNLKNYLISFFFFNMGVQTVMYVATVFAEKELKLPSTNLIGTVLILQLIAIPGALISARVSKKFGNIYSLIIQCFIWIVICIAAYFVRNGIDFYVLAIFVGLVMGGIQALSRSTYSKLIPKDTKDNASYFSFYEVTDKLSIVIGTLSYGVIEQWTGSARNSVLALGAFFVVGILLLLRLKKWNGGLV